MTIANTVVFKKVVDEKHLAFGEVYAPDVLDTHGHFMTADTIEKMAHSFLSNGFVSRVDTNHDLEENGTQIVQSFVARKGDPDFIEGSWVVAVHVKNDDLWNAIKSGELNGFSLYGSAMQVEKFVEIEIPDDGIVAGKTKKHDDHEHTYSVSVDTLGRIVGGTTDSVNGHFHLIMSESVTELSGGHSHRFNILDDLLEATS